jgi:hypothetical protein
MIAGDYRLMRPYIAAALVLTLAAVGAAAAWNVSYKRVTGGSDELQVVAGAGKVYLIVNGVTAELTPLEAKGLSLILDYSVDLAVEQNDVERVKKANPVKTGYGQ